MTVERMIRSIISFGLCCLFLLSPVLGEADPAENKSEFKTKCPKMILLNKTLILKCEVNGASVTQTRCPEMKNIVFFYEIGEEPPALIGTSSYPDCNPTWQNNSRCVSKDPDTEQYVYEGRITMTTDMEGAYIKCMSDCQNRTFFTSEASGECQSIFVSYPCGDTSCKNGGTCVENGTLPSGFSCVCPSSDDVAFDQKCNILDVSASEATQVISPSWIVALAGTLSVVLSGGF